MIVTVMRIVDQLSEEIQAQKDQKRCADPGYEFVQLHQIALYYVLRATSSDAVSVMPDISAFRSCGQGV
jgi:hypothetical protein